MKGKDIGIPKYAGAHESRSPYDFLLELEKYKMAVDCTYEEMLRYVVPLALTEMQIRGSISSERIYLVGVILLMHSGRNFNR
jgi:hypothetical protein